MQGAHENLAEFQLFRRILRLNIHLVVGHVDADSATIPRIHLVVTQNFLAIGVAHDYPRSKRAVPEYRLLLDHLPIASKGITYRISAERVPVDGVHFFLRNRYGELSEVMGVGPSKFGPTGALRYFDVVVAHEIHPPFFGFGTLSDNAELSGMKLIALSIAPSSGFVLV
ncbi:hypothetical protein [Nocardia sp. NPDC050710]|uniref:hypothetical protein n=1 Tax=Nocardia sp. NPDC050710 TaxID=3157220 RepID=UPI0033FB8036